MYEPQKKHSFSSVEGEKQWFNFIDFKIFYWTINAPTAVSKNGIVDNEFFSSQNSKKPFNCLITEAMEKSSSSRLANAFAHWARTRRNPMSKSLRTNWSQMRGYRSRFSCQFTRWAFNLAHTHSANQLISWFLFRLFRSNVRETLQMILSRGCVTLTKTLPASFHLLSFVICSPRSGKSWAMKRSSSCWTIRKIRKETWTTRSLFDWSWMAKPPPGSQLSAFYFQNSH